MPEESLRIELNKLVQAVFPTLGNLGAALLKNYYQFTAVVANNIFKMLWSAIYVRKSEEY